MRLSACLLACLALSATGLVGLGSTLDTLDARAEPRSQAAPQIANARLKGKKLFVSGENFSDGAEILIDGERVKTKNDPDNPSTMLIAKKAGKTIQPDAVVTLNVRTSDGAVSEQFAFFAGLIVTLDESGKTIELKVGDRFLLALTKGSYEWAPTVLNTSIIRKVSDIEQIKGSQGLYEAVSIGETRLQAVGDLPCAKSTPPCLAPSLWFDLGIVVR